MIVVPNTGGRVGRDLLGAFGGVMTLTVRFVCRAHCGEKYFERN
jgi:hypothetical protein